MHMQSINPATGEVIATFPLHHAAAVRRILDDVEQAFPVWSRLTIADRAAHFVRLADLCEAEKDPLSRLMTLEMGKPIAQSRAEIDKCIWVCRYYAENAAAMLSDERVETDARSSYVRFDPLGIVLGVMPWNFPFWQVFRYAVPALLAGNVTILKHASNVPQCAVQIETLFRRAGFPENIFRTLLIDSTQARILVEDPRIRAVTVTGSEIAGRSLAETAGRNLKKIVLELGGSDPFIVLPDADLEKCLKTAVQARIVGNGQSCIAAKRFILVGSVREPFTERLRKAMVALRCGDPNDETNDLGPLAREDLVEDLDRQVKESLDRGAVLLAGGGRTDSSGYFYLPTVLDRVKPGMPAYDEELFGPVIALIEAGSEEEAVRIANDTVYGLGASIWTKDLEKGEKLAGAIDAGMVFINGMVRSDPRLPFGGVKRSGFGRELSHYGIKEFVNIKTVWVE